MRILLIVLLTLLFSVFTPLKILLSGEIYKWVDEDGVIHFTDYIRDVYVFKKHNVEVMIVPDYKPQRLPNSTKSEKHKERKSNYIKEKSEKVVSSAPSNKQKRRQVFVGKTPALKSKKPKKSLKNVSIKQKKIYKYNTKIRKQNEAAKREYKKRMEEYKSKQKEYNTKMEEYKSKQKEYNTKMEEYQKKQRETEKYNVKVREQNARIRELNAQREQQRKQQSRHGIEFRKPYLGDNDPNKAYHRRHPAERGWDHGQ